MATKKCMTSPQNQCVNSTPCSPHNTNNAKFCFPFIKDNVKETCSGLFRFHWNLIWTLDS